MKERGKSIFDGATVVAVGNTTAIIKVPGAACGGECLAVLDDLECVTQATAEVGDFVEIMDPSERGTIKDITNVYRIRLPDRIVHIPCNTKPRPFRIIARGKA